MSVGSKEDRIAILLSSMGDDFADSVLQHVPDSQASALNAAISRLRSNPPERRVVSDVLNEFNRFFDFALANSTSVLEQATDEEEEESPIQAFVSSGDPFKDLGRLHDYQIAGALRGETGLTVSVILRQLSEERVGEVMQHLSDEVKEDAFLRMQKSPPIPRPLLTKIVNSIVAKASQLDASAASDPEHLADEKTAGLLRAMDRKSRSTLMKALEKRDADVAERVKGLLFRFDDILRFTDKSVQNLLKQIDSGTLPPALKNADPEIVDRISDNLSKQAKANLFEEIEFLDSLPEELEQQSRNAICNIMATMDAEGELEFVD